LNSAKNPVVIVGSEALQREDGGAVINLVQQIADNAKVWKLSGLKIDDLNLKIRTVSLHENK